MDTEQLMRRLVLAAETRGAAGIADWMQQHRKQASDVLRSLVGPGDGTAQGGWMRMEQALSIRAQRELWSALARRDGAIPYSLLSTLVDAYLRVAAVRSTALGDPCDAVCLALVRSLADARSKNDERESPAQTQAALELKLQAFVVHPLVMPWAKRSIVDKAQRVVAKEEAVQYHGIAPAPASAAAMPVGTPVKKRPRLQAEPEEHEATEALTPEDSGPALSADIQERALVLAKQLAQLAAPEAQSNRSAVESVTSSTVQILQETMDAVGATQASNERSFLELCKALQLAATSDEVLFQIASVLAETNWSSRYAALFLETSVLPKILAASSAISRVLLQTASLFIQRYAPTLIAAVLIPLVTAEGIGSPQGEAVTRIIRNGIPADQLNDFVLKSLQHRNVEASSSNVAMSSAPRHSMLENESALLVLQNVLNMNAALSVGTVELLIEMSETALEAQDKALAKSVKFATLLFTLVSKYPEQCADHVDALEGMAKQLTSLMAKATMRSIQRLKTNAVTRSSK